MISGIVSEATWKRPLLLNYYVFHVVVVIVVDTQCMDIANDVSVLVVYKNIVDNDATFVVRNGNPCASKQYK